jgi:hypothetical protein
VSREHASSSEPAISFGRTSAGLQAARSTQSARRQMLRGPRAPSGTVPFALRQKQRGSS